MQFAVAISYFHRKIGPLVYYVYPKGALEEEEKTRLADIMDQSFEEGSFINKFGNLTAINYYFEISSEWARGNKEMLMISTIMDKTPDSKVESLVLMFCDAFIKKMRNTHGIYKAFYNIDDSHVSEKDVQKIHEYSKNVKNWLNEFYWTAVEQIRERTEEEKWANIMAKPEIFKVIEILSQGPLSLEDLRTWFRVSFPKKDLNQVLDRLKEERFIFINSIGQDSYVLLVKEVTIHRVPPNCVIDLEEDVEDQIELTNLYIDEVREFFENYIPDPNDSLDLFALFSQPKLYNVISQLRAGPVPQEKVFSMVSEASSKQLLKNLNLLKEKNIIQTFSYRGVFLYLLKSDVILTARFPEYMRNLIPKEIKGYKAQSYFPGKFEKPINPEKIKPKSTLQKEIPWNKSNLIEDSIVKESPEINLDDEKHKHKDFGEESKKSKEYIAKMQKELLKKMKIN